MTKRKAHARNSTMKITIVGSGYVGLVTGACFADCGHEVVCVDHDAAKIDLLNNGCVPIYEPGLAELLAMNRARGTISFTTETAPAVAGADAIFIAVGTPARGEEWDADLSYVYSAASRIAPAMRPGALVVLKSTVPVGTGDAIDRMFAVARPRGSFSVVSNPEFLREGTAIQDFMAPDRVVVGTEDAAARKVMLDIYAPLAGRNVPIVFTQRRTAELIKYASNSFLAAKITFINEMADLCERVDANIGELALGMGLDKRIGGSFLNAGPGYGGSCFPKDTLALLRTAKTFGVSLRLVEETVVANEARKRNIALSVASAVGGSVRGKRLAVLGLSFKPNTDDVRDSPAIYLVEALKTMGANVRAYDPVAMEKAAALVEDVEFCESPYACAKDAEAVVIVTDWDVFKSLDLHLLGASMKGDTLIDFRNIVRKEDAVANGLRLFSVGHAPPAAHDDQAGGLGVGEAAGRPADGSVFDRAEWRGVGNL